MRLVQEAVPLVAFLVIVVSALFATMWDHDMPGWAIYQLPMSLFFDYTQNHDNQLKRVSASHGAIAWNGM